VGLDVRLVIRRLGGGTLAERSLADWTLAYWPVGLDLVVLGADLVGHPVLLLFGRSRAVLPNKTPWATEIFPPLLQICKTG
jgi:hypothetical protein